MLARRDNFLFKLDGKWRGKCGTDGSPEGGAGEQEAERNARKRTHGTEGGICMYVCRQVGIAHEGTISG